MQEHNQSPPENSIAGEPTEAEWFDGLPDTEKPNAIYMYGLRGMMHFVNKDIGNALYCLNFFSLRRAYLKGENPKYNQLLQDIDRALLGIQARADQSDLNMRF